MNIRRHLGKMTKMNKQKRPSTQVMKAVNVEHELFELTRKIRRDSGEVQKQIDDLNGKEKI